MQELRPFKFHETIFNSNPLLIMVWQKPSTSKVLDFSHIYQIQCKTTPALAKTYSLPAAALLVFFAAPARARIIPADLRLLLSHRLCRGCLGQFLQEAQPQLFAG